MFSASLFFLQQPFESLPRVAHFDMYDFLLLGLGFAIFVVLLLSASGIKISNIAQAIKTDSIFAGDSVNAKSGFLKLWKRLLIYFMYLISAILFVLRYDVIFVEGFNSNYLMVFLVVFPFFVFLPILLCLYLSNFYNIVEPVKEYFWKKLYFIGAALLVFSTLSYFLLQNQLFLFQALIALLLMVSFVIHFRVIQFFIRSGLYWYYIILYFCTLEILPLIFLWMKFWK